MCIIMWNIYTHLWWRQRWWEREGRAGVLPGSVHTAALQKIGVMPPSTGCRRHTQINRIGLVMRWESVGNKQPTPCGGFTPHNVSLCVDERVKGEREWGNRRQSYDTDSLPLWALNSVNVCCTDITTYYGWGCWRNHGCCDAIARVVGGRLNCIENGHTRWVIT